MNFSGQLEKVKELFYISIARYSLSNKYLEDLQKRFSIVTDDKPFYIGKTGPKDNPINYDFKTTTGGFKTSIGEHKNILINNCIILLISLWYNYCDKNKLKKYYDDNILEVILYRNCIVHNNGVIDEIYIKTSKLKKYKIGDKLNISVTDFENILKYFEDK